jgi:uncharacterized protein YqjF (DUF2071 family)
MAQSWIDLLFAHWSVAPETLEPVVPHPLALDTLEDRAWIGITPFEVRNLRLRPTPALPFLSSFPEINVRTYVSFEGRPGIFFLSLDAASRLAVHAARRLYRVPYFHAHMSIGRADRELRYESKRAVGEQGVPTAAFRASYRPLGSPRPSAAGTLEHWLTERYCLYTLDEQEHVLRGEIQHPPWPLQPAEADIVLNTMADQAGIELVGEPLLHYAARQDVVFWSLRPGCHRSSVGGY